MPADELVVDIPPAVPADAVERLATATIEVLGRMPHASNGTFLVRLADPDGLAIYKPERGERPLWDFGPGLYRRERACYLLSELLGVGVVPPTVIRDDAPLGVGSLQWFVNADFAEHYFTLLDDETNHPRLQAIAVLDLLAHNTDRKSGHCLLERRPDPALPAVGAANADAAQSTDSSDPSPVTPAESEPTPIWAIDNGLCFSTNASLRTVIWDFADDAIPRALVGAAAPLAADGVSLLADAGIAELLTDDEVAAIVARAAVLVANPVFPDDPSGRGYPWPLV